MKIDGDNGVSLRTAKETDAEFILKLRIDPELNRYLSKVTGTLEDQTAFLKKYKEKEKQKTEYYFIIEHQNKPVGTVRLYNINYESGIFTWGSWIVEKGNPGEVALSSAYMSYYFGFHYLNLEKALIDVRKDNIKVCEFYKLYADFLHEDEIDCYLEFKKSNFNRFIEKFQNRIPNNVLITI